MEATLNMEEMLGLEEVGQEAAFRVKGRVLDKEGQPVTGLKVTAFDKDGLYIASALTDDAGMVGFECGTVPKDIRISKGQWVVFEKTVSDFETDGMIDFGDVGLIQLSPLAEWHIKGIVRDKMTGMPLPGLTVTVHDVDSSGAKTYYEQLGPVLPPVTDAAGKFDVWFNSQDFERQAKPPWLGDVHPDVLIQVWKDGLKLHTAPVDQDVKGSPHVCDPYGPHKGKAYVIDVDYVTATINKVGPVDATAIDASGRVTYPPQNPIKDRPFGGRTTIGGRIWGSGVAQWKLYYAEGSIGPKDPRLAGLDPKVFKKLAEGTKPIWDGAIHMWNTSGLEGMYTVVLVVWDKSGNAFHDTQNLFLHNTPLTGPPVITSPTPGATLSKKATPSVVIEGTASDDYFLSYALRWVGPKHTKLTTGGFTYPTAAGKYPPPVVKGKLADWDIKKLDPGPYCLRLEARDRTILNDGHSSRAGWWWNTLIITA